MRKLFIATVALLALAGCSSASVEEVDETSSGNTTATCSVLTDVAPGRPQVYFAPFDPVEHQALCVLDQAKREVVVAHYNIRTDRMLRKLVELKQRGVDVRVAVDKDNAANEWNTGDDYLEQNGVRIVRMKPGPVNSIMHLKVAVIDSEWTMTGSFNWNETAALGNDENMIVFKDAAIASRYRNEALEVIGDKPRATEGGKVTPTVEVHFAPEERVDATIVREIDAAKTDVDVAMFTFTMKNVGDALKRAIARGVKVRAVVERKQTALSTIEDELERAGARVVRGANQIGEHSAMHQKYAVIDGKRVLTGATNWTLSGTRSNEEDLLVIDDALIAQRYRSNFLDLLHVYASEDSSSEPNARGAVLFHVVHGGTQWGDRVVVTGDRPELGSWDPQRGVPVETADLFPSWTGRARLPAGTRAEYKFVTIRASGEVVWEDGNNRVLQVPASGRSQVISQNWGETWRSWTPAAN